jgi:hypothetical protein
MTFGLTAQQKRRVRHWLFEGRPGIDGRRRVQAKAVAPHQSPWWQVMCLTGVDYFSTLGYQPGIAFLAAGVLSPIATLVLVVLTLVGALPIYNRVAEASPHGQGSISMLEELLPRWKGKAFVLCLLGFAATDFVITITLSAADATAHIVGNPFFPARLNHPVLLTLLLLTGLCAIFLKGFKEAIGLAVVIVGVYLTLNAIVLAVALERAFSHPALLGEWRASLFASPQTHGSVVAMVGIALWLFPKLALGLSGFETGVAVMPLVQGNPDDAPDYPIGRIRNTQKLLRTAALIMSVALIGSSLATTLLIPAAEFGPGGQASGRALAYLAHRLFGEIFGTVYDLSTISILWFAGASAMAGLLQLVPRYLPRYGMAPEWTKATRPLVLLFGVITFLITYLFDADVDAQGGAYATGVLVLMTSAAVAVTLLMRGRPQQVARFGAITAVFVYTTLLNIYERPEGIKIASWFIATIIVTSMISRVLRSTELRVQEVHFDPQALRFLRDAGARPVRILAIRPGDGRREAYEAKMKEASESHHLPESQGVLFLEVRAGDSSDFSDTLDVFGADVGGYRVLRAMSPAIPNAIAALLLHIRDRTGNIPHAYFGWTEGNPIVYLLKFLAFGEGDTAPVTREVLRQTESNPRRRPRIHVG